MHLEQEFWLDLGDIKYPFKPDLIVRENGIVTLFRLQVCRHHVR